MAYKLPDKQRAMLQEAQLLATTYTTRMVLEILSNNMSRKQGIPVEEAKKRIVATLEKDRKTDPNARMRIPTPEEQE